MSTIITDPSVVAQFASGIDKTVTVDTIPPLDTTVYLPGGLRLANGDIAKTAEVKELTGADEEAISIIKNPGAKLNAVLERGVVKIGSITPGPIELDALLAGDRDALLLGIRRVTFGDTEPMSVVCTSCGVQQTVEINLSKDIDYVTFSESQITNTLSVQTKQGTLVLTYPNGVTQRKIAEAENKTTAELITMIISGCIVSLNDAPVIGSAIALQLGLQDRNKIIKLISEGAPGPRLGEVSKACEACGALIAVPLGLADLFRI